MLSTFWGSPRKSNTGTMSKFPTISPAVRRKRDIGRRISIKYISCFLVWFLSPSWTKWPSCGIDTSLNRGFHRRIVRTYLACVQFFFSEISAQLWGLWKVRACSFSHSCFSFRDIWRGLRHGSSILIPISCITFFFTFSLIIFFMSIAASFGNDVWLALRLVVKSTMKNGTGNVTSCMINNTLRLRYADQGKSCLVFQC